MLRCTRAVVVQNHEGVAGLLDSLNDLREVVEKAGAILGDVTE